MYIPSLRSSPTYLCAIMVILLGHISVFASTWNNPGTGSWATASNWTGGVPCGVGASAIFQCASANQLVTYPNFTVHTYGSLTIDDNNSFAIGQNNSDWVDWNNTGSTNIPITVNASGFTSAHTITADLYFYDCIDFCINSGSLEYTGNVSDIGASYGWNKTGNGRLIIDVTALNYDGANTISDGTVEIESTISLGDASFVSNTSVAAGSTLAIDIPAGGTIKNETVPITGTGDA